MLNAESASPSTVPLNWHELVFDQSFIDGCEKLGRKRFNNDVLAEESYNYVVEKLSEDNWKRCLAYQGKSKPSTFLFTLARNLIEEFARHRFGRPRPPAWLIEQGDTWVKLWKAVCLERQLVPSVIDTFTQLELRARDFVEHAIQVIKARIPSCGQSGAGECSTEDIVAVSDSHGMGASLGEEAGLIDAAEAKLFSLLMQNILDSSPKQLRSVEACKQVPENPDAKMLAVKLNALKDSLDLNNQELLLLRMIYVDGLSKSRAAVALGMPAHKGGRIVNDVLTRIRGQMTASGVDFQSLLALI